MSTVQCSNNIATGSFDNNLLTCISSALGGYFHFKRQNSASRVEEVRPVEKPHTNGNAATNTNGMYDKY